MKTTTRIQVWFANRRFSSVLVVGCGLLFFSLAAFFSFAAGGQTSPVNQAGKPSPVVEAFQKRVKEYVKLRERLEEKLPKLPTESSPEKIQGHQIAFTKMVQDARAGARQGDIFTPDITQYIRAIIREEFKGKDRRELKETVLEAETRGVPLRINYPYPETKELAQTPPTLLIKLPELSKQMRYRFVGRHLLLVDRENHLIIDYMLNALP